MTATRPGRTRPIPQAPGMRLSVAVLLCTIGGVGMWSVVVALPAVQADFGVDRADASLPYTLTMLGFGFGGVLMGRLADRFGITVPLALGALALALGYVAVGLRRDAVAGRARPWLADRLRLLGDLRAADGRHVALVRAPARHRGRACGLRQLSRRHDLAAGGAAFHRQRRAGARRISASACSASSPCCRWRCCCAAAIEHRAHRRPRVQSAARAASRTAVLAGDAAGAAVHRRRRLLRGDVDAAGPSSSPIAAISATAWRAAPRCCR